MIWIVRSLISKYSGNRGELYHTKRNGAEMNEMAAETKPTSTLWKNAEVLHVLYGLLDSDREPTDADAHSLRLLYASS